MPHGATLIATSSLVPNQAFRYGDNAYGLQFHIEVTAEMIRKWIETYEEEIEGPHPPLLSKLKILSDTELKIEAYKKRGKKFLKNFLKDTSTGGMR